MASVSESTIGGYVSLLDDTRGLDIGGGVGISPSISSSTDSGSVAMSRADTDSGDNDGNSDDAATSDVLDDGDDIGKDDDLNTHPSYNILTITVHGGEPQTKEGKHAMTEPFFCDSADFILSLFLFNRTMTSISIMMFMMRAQPGFLRFFNTDSITRLQHGLLRSRYH